MNNRGSDPILDHGLFTTLDRSNPAASAASGGEIVRDARGNPTGLKSFWGAFDCACWAV